MGVQILFCVFHPFLNSPQNFEHFDYRHIGSNKEISRCRMPKTKSPAPQTHLFRTTVLGSVEGGGYPPSPLGSGAAPVSGCDLFLLSCGCDSSGCYQAAHGTGLIPNET